jgi:L-lactate dehydrogenase complex protein LldG
VTGTRERILQAVRAGLGTPRHQPAAIAVEAAALLEDLELIRPGRPDIGLVERFVERASVPKVGTTVERVAGLAELPAAVRRYLAAHGLPEPVAVQPTPELQRLDWVGLATHPGTAADEPVGVGLARWGIAETGSLVFHSGPDMPILSAFLPLHHIVALRTDAILPWLDDYAALAGPAPRNAVVITGASGTTDIEGSYVRGAHGPGYLHVVLVESRPGQ